MQNNKDKRTEIINKRGYPLNLQGDLVSLYISNYLDAAGYLAERIGNKEKTVVELCCGVGVTLGKLAKTFKQAIGVEVNDQILKSCENNIIQSNVINNVQLIHGDIEDKKLLAKIEADIAIYDIPYWDIGISREKHSSRKNPKLKETVGNIRELITKDIVVCAPTHYTYETALADLGPCEYQMIYRPTYKRNYIYLGQLVEKEGITKLTL